MPSAHTPDEIARAATSSLLGNLYFWSQEEKERVEGIAEEIVRWLRRPEAEVYKGVGIACLTMMQTGAPNAEDLSQRQRKWIAKQKKLEQRLHAFAEEGLSLLRDLPPNAEWRIFEEYIPFPILDHGKKAKLNVEGKSMHGEDGHPIQEKLDAALPEGNKERNE